MSKWSMGIKPLALFLPVPLLLGVARRPAPQVVQPTEVAFGFAAIHGADATLLAYALPADASGQVRFLGKYGTASSADPYTAVAVAPSGKSVFEIVDTSLWGWSVAADGKLAPLPGAPWTLDSPATTLVVGRNDEFLYLGTRANGVLAYQLARSGGKFGLRKLATPAATTGYSSVVLDPAGKLLYAGAGENGSVVVYRVNGDKGLAEVKSFPMTNSRRLLMDPRGALLFGAASPGPLSVAAINKDGTLTAGPEVKADPGILALAEDHTGSWLYGVGPAAVFGYRVGEGGALGAMGSWALPDNHSGHALAIDPYEPFLYAGDDSSGLYQWRLDPVGRPGAVIGPLPPRPDGAGIFDLAVIRTSR